MINWHSDIDRWMDTFFGSDFRLNENISTIRPMVNVEETENEFIISAEIPGMDKKEINIVANNGMLSISGEKKDESETKEKNYHQIERRYGKFERSFVLPEGVDHEKIEASYKNGVLTLSLPKMEEAKPKQIEVKVK